jgi:hypothetical protein
LKPQYKIGSNTTIADQASYSLPTDSRIENVWSIMVEETASGEDHREYKYAPFGQNNSRGRYFTRGPSVDTFMLFYNGEPLTTASREILIYYYERPVNFDGSDLTVEPALDTDFHDYFWMKLIEDNASCGDYPDFTVANAWGNRADAYFLDIKNAMEERFNTASPMIMQCKEYF